MCPQCHSRGWPPGPRAGTPVPSGSRKQTRVAARGPGVTCGAAQRDDAGRWGERTHLPGTRRDAPTSPSATGWSPAAPPLPARAWPWERAPGGPHAQAGQAARGGLAGRGPSSLAPCALPRLPALPAGGGAGRVPVRRADPAQDLARPPAPGGEGPRSPESEDREEGADSPLPRNDGRDAAPEPVPLRTGGSRPAAGRALGRRCVAAPLLLTR